MVSTFNRVWINRAWLANPARGQLRSENDFFRVPVGAWEFCVARKARPSRPASPCSFSALWLNLVLIHGIPNAFRDGVHVYRQPPTGQPRVYRATQFRTDGVHSRQSAGTGPVVLKAVRVMGAAFSGITMDQFLRASLFPHPLLACTNTINSMVVVIGYRL